MSLAQQDMQKWIQILKGNDKSKWDGAINDFYGFSASYVWLIFNEVGEQPKDTSLSNMQNILLECFKEMSKQFDPEYPTLVKLICQIKYITPETKSYAECIPHLLLEIWKRYVSDLKK